jgi:hypothetical protein
MLLSYLKSTARMFLICLALGLFLLALKAIAYKGYLAHGEWRQDTLIWLTISVVFALLDPVVTRIAPWRKRSK